MPHLIYILTCQLCVRFLSFGRCLCSATQTSSSLFGEEPPVCVGRIVRRQVRRYQKVLGIVWQLDV